MAEVKITIVNQLGLHARAAGKFVSLASSFRSQIEIVRGVEVVDGKSILGVLGLAAPRGTELRLVARGPDEEQALAALSDLVSQRFGEER